MSSVPAGRTCPNCGAELAAGDARCWLCLEARGDERAAASSAAPHEPQRWTFSLSSLMLFITLVAVTLGISGLSPGLGVAFGVLAAPALVRTAVAARRARVSGGLNVYEKVWAFLGSLGVVVLTGLAAVVAFYATCWAGLAGAAALDGGLAGGLTAGVILGIIAGIVVLILMIRWLWPIRGSRP